jgi:DNA-binding NarL/FixJ family response regulator
MRVLLADKDTRICSALNLLLKSDPKLEVVGESKDVDSLLKKAKSLMPDLILLDWELSGKPDASVLRQICQISPPPWVIALSGDPDSEHKALSAGADEFVSKADSAHSLLETLQRLFELEERGSRPIPC